MSIYAIDPGDRHVGWCRMIRYAKGDRRATHPEQGWDVYCEELTPGQAVARARNFRSAVVDLVIIEEFVLYPGQDSRNVGNRMATSELIGKLELICELAGVPVVRQPASIKKPTRGNLRGRGIRQVGSGTHQRDAELHGWYWALRNSDA
jgi:hypothetical protein